MADIYNYVDYRQFLKDHFEDRKKQGEALTQRSVLKMMDISSTGFLANVFSGKKNLTIDQLKSMANILEMNTNEANYFKYMLYFSKAKTIGEKNDFYETLNSLRRKKLKKLDKNQLSLFAKWYYVVIREVLGFYKFKDDFKALALMVEPNITPGQAKKTIEELEELGLIVKDKKGFYQQVDSLISTGDEVQSFHVKNFNMAMTELEKQALENISPQERDLSGVTIGLSEASFQKLKVEIQEFRKKALQIAEEDKRPEKVYRCNIKFFPVSKKNPE